MMMSTRVCVLAILCILYAMPPLRAEPPKPEDWFDVDINNSGNGRTFYGDCIFHMGGPVAKDTDNGLVGHNLQTFPRSISGTGGSRGYGARFPPVRVGDILPIRDSLYRVASLSDKTISFRLVPAADFPQGVSFAVGSIVAPETQGGVEGNTTYYLNNIIYVRRFEPRAAKDQPARATLEMWPNGVSGPKTPPANAVTATVKPGDILVFSHVHPKQPDTRIGIKVLAVVPPDPDKHMIGWVELDPKGFRGEEEIAKHGDAVVRPVKLKK